MLMGLQGTRHYKSLDGLRGLAALVVVFHHYVCAFFPALIGLAPVVHTSSNWELKISETPLFLAFCGNLAVYIFFVLSTFVLSAKFFKTSDPIAAHATIVKSFVKRYFRLMIPVVVSVLLSYILFVIHGYKNSPAAVITQSPWLSRYWLEHVTFMQAVWEGTIGVFFNGTITFNNVLWTMKIELLGSFMLFAALLFVGRLRSRWLFYGAAIVLMLHSNYLCFVLGMILSDLWHTEHDMVARIHQIYGWLLLAVGLWLGMWHSFPWHASLYSHLPLFHQLPEQMEQLAHSIGGFCIVAAVLLLRPVQLFFTTKPLQFLGKISFSMYLLHALILGSFASYLFVHLLHDYSYGVSFAIMFAVALLITFIVSWIYARWVDRTAVIVSNRIGAVLTSERTIKITWPAYRPNPKSVLTKISAAVNSFTLTLL